MPVLALETATLVSGVALATESALLAEWKLETTKTHSELLLPHIEMLLQAAQVEKQQLQAVAVSLGPGSFTGLRIGLATAKALAYALGIPLIGVPTLEALAYNCPAPGLLLSPFLDAQKGNVYQGRYRIENGRVVEAQPPRVIAFRTALEELIAAGEPAMALGEGVAWLRQPAYEAWREALVPTPLSVAMPRAASVAALAWQRLQQDDCDEAMTLEPMYIRRSEAEVLWEKRHGREAGAV